MLKIMQLLQLGKIGQGSPMPDGKYTSLSARWFSCKKETEAASSNKAPDDDSLCIEHN